MIGISTKSIYAVAALQVLGSIPPNEVAKIKEIAATASIPQNFLEQILLELKKQGILSSTKGVYGGYKLAKGLHEITLKDVVLVLESEILSEIDQKENPALQLFWGDVRQKASAVLEIPLSELEACQLKANQTLNYSI